MFGVKKLASNIKVHKIIGNMDTNMLKTENRLRDSSVVPQTL